MTPDTLPITATLDEIAALVQQVQGRCRTGLLDPNQAAADVLAALARAQAAATANGVGLADVLPSAKWRGNLDRAGNVESSPAGTATMIEIDSYSSWHAVGADYAPEARIRVRRTGEYVNRTSGHVRLAIPDSGAPVTATPAGARPMRTALRDHPLAATLPLLPEVELEALAEDIKANGQLVPITLYEGQILDGRNRYRACRRAGVVPLVQHFEDLDTPAHPVSWAHAANVSRRHLDHTALAFYGARLVFALRALRKGREDGEAAVRVGGRVARLPPGKKSRDIAAELARVSARLVADAMAVLQQATPDLAAAAEAKAVPIYVAAYVARHADDATQDRLLREGEDALRSWRRQQQAHDADQVDEVVSPTDRDDGVPAHVPNWPQGSGGPDDEQHDTGAGDEGGDDDFQWPADGSRDEDPRQVEVPWRGEDAPDTDTDAEQARDLDPRTQALRLVADSRAAELGMPTAYMAGRRGEDAPDNDDDLDRALWTLGREELDEMLASGVVVRVDDNEPEVATPRAKKRKRRDADFYPTPLWCTQLIAEFGPELPEGGCVELCCGDGAIILAVGAERFELAIDLRAECSETVSALGVEFIQADIREFDLSTLTDATLLWTNPPFSLAFEIVTRLRRELPHVPVLLLLRLGFFESEDRHEWLKRNMPDVYLLPNRPSFVGGTDMTTYGWFYWPAGPGRTHGLIHLLPYVPSPMRTEGYIDAEALHGLRSDPPEDVAAR